MPSIRKRIIPYWTILSDNDLAKIHEATNEVMEKIGVAVYDDEALELLRRAGATIDGQVAGARDLGSKVKDKAQKILQRHQPEPLTDDIRRRLKTIAE